MNERPLSASLAYETPPSISPTIAMMLGLVFTRLLGLYFIIQAAVCTTLFYMAWNTGSVSPATWSINSLILYAGIPIAYAVTGVFLFFRAETLSGRMFSKTAHDGGMATGQQIFVFIIAGVGLLAFVTSLQAVFSMLASLFQLVQYAGTSRTRSTSMVELSTLLGPVGALAQPAAGLFLFFKADRVARFAQHRFDGRIAAETSH